MQRVNETENQLAVDNRAVDTKRYGTNDQRQNRGTDVAQLTTDPLRVVRTANVEQPYQDEADQEIAE